MREPKREEARRRRGEGAKRGSNPAAPRLLESVLLAAWLIFVVAMYLGHQTERLLRLLAEHR
ncbi:MAG: hypothetical protein ACE149_10770 [Armatimonadota bacterium]